MSRIQIPPNSFDACKVSGRACYTHAQPCMYSMSWRNPWCIDRDIFEKVYLSDGTNQIIPKKSLAGSPANPVCAQRRFAPRSAVRFVRPATCSLKHIWAIIHVHSKLRGWRNFHFWKLQFNARHDPVRSWLLIAKFWWFECHDQDDDEPRGGLCGLFSAYQRQIYIESVG